MVTNKSNSSGYVMLSEYDVIETRWLPLYDIPPFVFFFTTSAEVKKRAGEAEWEFILAVG